MNDMVHGVIKTPFDLLAEKVEALEKRVAELENQLDIQNIEAEYHSTDDNAYPSEGEYGGRYDR